MHNDAQELTRRKIILVSILLMVFSLITACGAAEPASEPQMAEAPQATDSTGSRSINTGDATSDALGQSSEQVAPRLIVYTGNINLVVKDTGQTIASITQLTAETGGYVAEANIYNVNNIPQGTMTIKVPAKTYQDVLQQLRRLAIRVESENSSTQDVTEEFVDLEARKANLQVTEQALQELLQTRQKTGNIEDILEVHRELTSVRGQIEQIQGRLNFLSKSAAMSTIHIDLTPDELAQPLTVAGWQPTGVAREALRSLISALQTLVDFWIWLIIFILPILITYLTPLAVVIWLLVRWWRKQRQRVGKNKSAKSVLVAESELPPEED